VNQNRNNSPKARFGDEQSEIRSSESRAPDAGSKSDGSTTRVPDESGTLNAVRADGEDSIVVRKNQRIAAKVKTARKLLETLPQGDRRTRLLHAATVRRDEVLLDALLQELGVQPSESD
jgi:hypothetical protein